MADVKYNKMKELLGLGALNFAADTIKCALLTSAHEPSAEHEKWADVADDEVAEVEGNGYDAGGKVLAGVTWTQTGGTAQLAATNPAWTTASFTARYAAIYAAKTVGSGEDEVVNPLICLLDFGSDKVVTSGTFTVAFNASGIMTMS